MRRKIIVLLVFMMYTILLFSLVLSSLMEYGWIDGDLGPFHRYVASFNGRAIATSLIMTILILVSWYKKWFKVEIIMGCVALLAAVFTIDAVGNLFGWYAANAPFSIVWFDDLVHVVSPMCLTILLYFLMYYWLFISGYSVCNDWIKRKAQSKIMMIIFATLGASFIGMLFEVSEYISDTYFHSYMVGGVEDICTDLIYNTIGNLFGLLALFGVVFLDDYKSQKR